MKTVRPVSMSEAAAAQLADPVPMDGIDDSLPVLAICDGGIHLVRLGEVCEECRDGGAPGSGVRAGGAAQR